MSLPNGVQLPRSAFIRGEHANRQSSRFPLEEHLVGVQTDIAAPDYVQQHPKTDMSAVLTKNQQETYQNVDVLKGWPTQPQSKLDASQLAALRRMISKRLAIVQGRKFHSGHDLSLGPAPDIC